MEQWILIHVRPLTDAFVLFISTNLRHRKFAGMMNLPLPSDRLRPFKSNLDVSGKPTQLPQPEWCSISLSEFAKPLLTAIDQGQPWVSDFENDTIMLPRDLHEVIQAYTKIQNRKAA